jgi:predicted dehydrogenase
MTQPHTPLGLGIIGLGAIAESRHLPILAKSPRYKLVAGYDLDRERAARMGQQFQIAKITENAQALLDSTEIDLVAILTPPITHAELAHAALDAGKHVFVEKPLTLDLTEAQDLAAHVERARTRLFLGFNQRRHRLVQQLRGWMKQGRLGEISAVHSTLSNNRSVTRRRPWKGNDLTFEVAVHHFDLWRYLFGSEVDNVFAQRGVRRDGAEAVTLLANMTSGTVVSATFAEGTTEHNSLELFCERGRAVLSLYRFDGLVFIPRGSFEGGLNIRAQQAREVLSNSGGIARRLKRGGDYELSYAAQWEHVAAGIGSPGPYEPNVHDGVAATRTALAVRESLAANQVVQVAQRTMAGV